MNNNEKTSERELLRPALEFIKNNPNTSMKQVREWLGTNFAWKKEDYEPSSTRIGELKFQQIIRNLKSHNTLTPYIDIDTTTYANTFTINDNGLDYIKKEQRKEENKIDIDEIINEHNAVPIKKKSPINSPVEDPFKSSVPKKMDKNNNKRWTTDPELKNEVLEEASGKCYLEKHFTKKNHNSFPTISQVNYLEGHHFIKMSTQGHDLFYKLNEDEIITSLDCIANIIPLCPNCHKQIHYGLDNDIREMIKLIYDLQDEDWIKHFGNITLEDLYFWYGVEL